MAAISLIQLPTGGSYSSVGLKVLQELSARIFLSQVSGEKLTLFCHGTEVSKNGLSLESMGLGSEFPVSLDLTCVDKEFQHNGDKIGIDKLYGATCTRVLEPFITKEEKSDCSNGMGADGRTDDLDLVSLVKVGWLFGDGEFQEQVSTT